MSVPEPVWDGTGGSFPLVARPPFRLIAIADTPARIDYIARLASAWGETGFGLMLRDPGHRRDAVEFLAGHALSLDLPPNVTLITNAYTVPGIAHVHYPSAFFPETAAPSTENIPQRSTGISWGYSAHSSDQAMRAATGGALYITFSPVFPTASKPGHPGTGLDTLQHICAAIPIRVFALGGINPHNASHVLRSGAYGIASISMFAPECRESLEELLELMVSGW